MLVIGAILIVAAVVVGAFILLGTGQPAGLDVVGLHVTSGPAGYFLVGAGAGVALVVGLVLLTGGLHHGVRRQLELRRLRKQAAAGSEQAAVDPPTDPRELGTQQAADRTLEGTAETAPGHGAGRADGGGGPAGGTGGDGGRSSGSTG